MSDEPKILQKLFLLKYSVLWKLSFEHFSNCRLSTFLSFEHFLKMGFCDLFQWLFTTQIIPDLLFSTWQVYILPSR